MEKYQEVFKRYEKKYLLTQIQYRKLRKLLDERMEIDEYGLHTICNIYFDTVDYSLIRTSLDKPVYKEKLRLRSYGVPRSGDTVFVEIKKKFDGIVYKRRVSMTLEEAKEYLIYGKKPSVQNQITREIDWVLKRYELSPAVYIAYDRLAMYGKENENLRITFDQNIRYREELLELGEGSFGMNIIQGDMVLMEIKIPDAMPVWMSHMLSELSVSPASFSKYGECYKNYIAVYKKNKGGIYCA